MKRYAQTTEGITIIESIVSITLLMVAVTGLMTLSASGIRSAGNSKNELIATNLAAEGLAIVHSMRDNNSADDTSLTHTGWVQNMFSRCNTANGCVVDVTGGNVVNVWNNLTVIQQCPCATTAMYIHQTTGLYRQTGAAIGGQWSRTPFSRIITMTGIDAAPPMRQMRVTSTVTYPGYRGNTQSISISEDLYNWFPEL